MQATVRACASLACLFVAKSAHAAPRLRWTAPPDCPAIAEVEADVERLLGGAPLDHVWPDALEAEGSVTRARAGWRVRVVTITADGRSERRLTGASCREAAQAAALLVAVAIDPSAGADLGVDAAAVGPPPAEPEPLAPAPAPPPPRSVAAPRVAVEMHVEPGSPVRVDVRAAGMVQAGALPAPTPGIGFALGISSAALRPGSFAIALGVAAAIPVRRPSFRLDGYGVVYEPSPVFGHAVLGIERSFP